MSYMEQEIRELTRGEKVGQAFATARFARRFDCA